MSTPPITPGYICIPDSIKAFDFVFSMFIIGLFFCLLVVIGTIYYCCFALEGDDYETILANKVMIPGFTDFSNNNKVKEDNIPLSYVYNPSKKRNDIAQASPSKTSTIPTPKPPTTTTSTTANSIIGNLTVRILRGVEIKTGKSIFGLADVYAVLVIGNQTKRTAVKTAGGMSPEWNEDVVFEISNEDTLNITIFDKESVDKDRYMAQASVSILDWIEHGTFEGSLNLVDKKNKSEGPLLLSATFKASDNTGSWI
jgi:hypothetical protein